MPRPICMGLDQKRDCQSCIQSTVLRRVMFRVVAVKCCGCKCKCWCLDAGVSAAAVHCCNGPIRQWLQQTLPCTETGEMRRL